MNTAKKSAGIPERVGFKGENMKKKLIRTIIISAAVICIFAAAVAILHFSDSGKNGNRTEETVDIGTPAPCETSAAQSIAPSESASDPGVLPSAGSTAGPADGQTVNTPSPAPETAPETVPETEPIVFIESEELHLPDLTEDLQFGQLFNLRGTVISENPLEKVTVKITSENGTDSICPFTGEITFSGGPVYEYALENKESPDGGKSVNDIVPFTKFAPGRHDFILSASDGENEIVIASTQFNIVKNECLQLISNNFRDNYSQALKFFGDPEKFMFRYKWDEGRNIITDPAWVKKYITSFKGFNGKWWTVHKDALPYFKNALDYMDTTYLRVHGAGHDSGIIKLSALVKSFNGTYVSRFVSDKTFISHHAFGTAVDINAGTKPFNNSTENWEIIKNETGKLAYNGINEYKNIKYYDFTYNGSWNEYYNGVPESLLNYLIYELAFYRAGFSWGYYYPHTCDGMHFTLTDLDKSMHENPGTGLRKVFSYCN